MRAEAWSLAQSTYRSPRLRPRFDEATARVLAGDSSPSRRDLRDLADTRDAIVDEGVASRKLLQSMARDLGLEGLLVVTREIEAPSAPVEPPDTAEKSEKEANTTPTPSPEPRRSRVKARLFDAASGRFELVDFRAGDDATWQGAAASIEHLVPPLAKDADPSPAAQANANANANAPKKEGSKSFYESPWFWGAAGAAAVLGGAFFLATRDSSSDSIHLQMQVPR